MHGNGVRTWAGGKIYRGQFKADKVLFSACRCTHFSRLNGQMWGEGEELWPSGETYVGSFRAGVYHGLGKVCLIPYCTSLFAPLFHLLAILAHMAVRRCVYRLLCRRQRGGLLCHLGALAWLTACARACLP